MSAPNASASASQLPAASSDSESQPAPRPRITFRLASGEMAEWTAEDLPQLSENQIRALQVLSNGFGVADAADAAGVSRATVYRWLSRDPAVRSIYNRWKRVCFESAQSRLVALQNAAVDVLAEEVENKHNPKYAAMILDKMGVMRPAPLGADTAAAASKEIEVEDGELKTALGERAQKIRWSSDSLSPSDRVQEIKTPQPTAATPAPGPKPGTASDSPA